MMGTVRIYNLGVCEYYKSKYTNGGVYFWLYCKDGVTKMPEPVFVRNGQYELT